jgi:hypothetical protein
MPAQFNKLLTKKEFIGVLATTLIAKNWQLFKSSPNQGENELFL